MNFFRKTKAKPKDEAYKSLNDTVTDNSPFGPTPYTFGAQPQSNKFNPSLNSFGSPVFSSNQFYATPTYQTQTGTYGPTATTNTIPKPYAGKQVYPTFEQKSIPTPTTNINLESPIGTQFNGAAINNYRPQIAPVKKVIKQNYYTQKVSGSIPIERTPIIGAKEMDLVEFDDYFEKHADKFFSPEVDEIFLYFTKEYLVGLQFCYRDSWGREDRETYKGNRQMSKSESLKNYFWSSLKLDFDEYLKEIYGEGDTHVTYLKVVTNKLRTIECGTPSGFELKNLIPDLSKVIGVGGSYGMCVSNIIFLLYLRNSITKSLVCICQI